MDMAAGVAMVMQDLEIEADRESIWDRLGPGEDIAVLWDRLDRDEQDEFVARAKAINRARFIYPGLFEEIEAGGSLDDPSEHVAGLLGVLNAVLEEMGRVRLLIVELNGIDPDASQKWHPSGLPNRLWYVADSGILPWLGPDTCGALEAWIDETTAEARAALDVALALLREEAQYRNAAGLLALLLAARRPLVAGGSPRAAQACCECRPPPTTLLTAGGCTSTFVLRI